MAVRIKIPNKNYIPDLIEPSLKDWRQPDRKDILIDDQSALMSRETSQLLQDVPVKFHAICQPGKMFKYDGNLIWFGFHANPTKVSINYRKIYLINDFKSN